MNVEGGEPQALADNNYSPADGMAWSPDRTRVAFTSNRDGDDEIYVMDADGSNKQRLTDNDADDRGPVWSPDGYVIAFTSDRDGDDEIFVMYVDGSNLRQADRQRR